MCGCEPGFTCSRCAGTPSDDAYLDTPDAKERDEDNERRETWDERQDHA